MSVIEPLTALQNDLNRCFEKAMQQTKILNSMCMKNPFFGALSKTTVTQVTECSEAMVTSAQQHT